MVVGVRIVLCQAPATLSSSSHLEGGLKCPRVGLGLVMKNDVMAPAWYGNLILRSASRRPAIIKLILKKNKLRRTG
jgi:hypothetical protein